jgi:hypothetical protein
MQPTKTSIKTGGKKKGSKTKKNENFNRNAMIIVGVTIIMIIIAILRFISSLNEFKSSLG